MMKCKCSETNGWVSLFFKSLSLNTSVHVSLSAQLWADEAVLEGSALWETPLLTNLSPAQQDAGGQEGNDALNS